MTSSSIDILGWFNIMFERFTNDELLLHFAGFEVEEIESNNTTKG